TPDVQADPRLVQVRCRRVDREHDQLLHLGVEVTAAAPRRSGQTDVRGEELGVELEQPVERLVPRTDLLEIGVTQLAAALGGRLGLPRHETAAGTAGASSIAPRAVRAACSTWWVAAPAARS